MRKLISYVLHISFLFIFSCATITRISTVDSVVHESTTRSVEYWFGSFARTAHRSEIQSGDFICIVNRGID